MGLASGVASGRCAGGFRIMRMMRKICWTVVFVVSALLLPSASAEAAWVSCPGTAATTDREFKINVSGATCLTDGFGTGNISGSGDAINNLGWITLDKSDDTTTGALQGVLQITGTGSTQGTFTINPLAWATYSQIVLAFKSGQGQINPDWAAFVLPANTLSGSWRISGQQSLSHANLYGNGTGQQPPIPEPATLALLGTGLALSRLVRGKRRSADNRTIV
jgi:hypothetical protein